MVFGYMVVQRLLVLVRVFSRLPDAVSRVFARSLNAAITPFNIINYYGSCAAALVYNRHRMGAKMDRVIASLQRKLARESDDSLRRGMHFPTRWDPFFKDYMTVEDVYRYPASIPTSTSGSRPELLSRCVDALTPNPPKPVGSSERDGAG
jgi:hypothetical protein